MVIEKPLKVFENDLLMMPLIHCLNAFYSLASLFGARGCDSSLDKCRTALLFLAQYFYPGGSSLKKIFEYIYQKL